jgi:hypothetical protein
VDVAEHGERGRAELWAASVREYNRKRQAERVSEWCEHFRRMRSLHWALGDEYDAKLQKLEDGHHQERSA